MRNLVENATTHGAGPGGIDITLAPVADEVRLVVTDNGPGMSSDHAAHVFERFHRVDEARTRSTGGTGLGLALVRAVAQRWGGRATIESAPGQGTSVAVHLPAAPGGV